MKLHLLSINVWGINNDHKVEVIRDYIGGRTPGIGILCLQKHISRGDNVDMNIMMLWKKYKNEKFGL